MKTRREILKSSLGIAGIIAAGKAPAAIVRSLVGANGITFIDNREGMPTAKDYIKNGLVVLQDGIENVDYGVHDSNATIWYNLVNHNVLGYDLSKDTSSSPLTWTDIGLLRNSIVSRTGLMYKMYSPTSPYTLECIARISSSAMFSNIFGLSNPFGCGFGAAWQYHVGAGTVDGHNYILFPRNTIVSTSALIPTSTKADVSYYLNAELQEPLSNGRGMGGTNFCLMTRCTGEAHCLRIYNRLLSESEIAHNYAIDKERFGLA